MKMLREMAARSFTVISPTKQQGNGLDGGAASPSPSRLCYCFAAARFTFHNVSNVYYHFFAAVALVPLVHRCHVMPSFSR